MSDPAASQPTIPGLPGKLPKGERVLWQGRPATWPLARDALSVKWIAVYFAIVALWRAGSLMDLMPVWAAASAAVPFVIAGVVVCGLLYLVALWQARSTVYTITTDRVVMQIGAALSLTLNLPYKQIAGADLDLRKDGTGTIALALKPSGTRLSYLVCWPHARPWRLNPAQPALRAIPDAEKVAGLLAEAAAVGAASTPSDMAAIAAPVAAE